MNALNVAGTVLQVAGVLMTGYGASKTWHEFAPEGERFLHPVRARWHRLLDWLQQVGRSFLRRSPRAVVARGGVAIGVGGAFSARGRVQYPALGTDVATGHAIAELDRRTRQLSETIANTADRLDEDLGGVRKDVADLGAGLGSELRRVDEQTRRVAIGGIRLEALGLVLIALGLFCQAIAGVAG